jgi:hypothetical protein
MRWLAVLALALLAACSRTPDAQVALDLCALDEAVRHECPRGMSERERDHCVARTAPQALRLIGGIAPQCRDSRSDIEGIEQ